MSAPYALLRRGAIYRIVYTSWKTNPRPIIFILYSGPTKVHALSINSPSLSAMDARRFSYFVQKMKAIKGVEGWTGRVLYNTLRTYFPDVVRKSYRTFKTGNIAGMTLVSTGIIKKEIFTDYELSFRNSMLYNASQNDVYLRTLNNLTGTGYKPPAAPPLYNPQKVVIPEKETSGAPAPPPATPAPQKPGAPVPPAQRTVTPSTAPQRPPAPTPPNKGPSPQTGAPPGGKISPNMGDSFSIYGEE
jgi:hypothetical protein